MSNTHSSDLASRNAARRLVGQLVTARAGREWCLFLDRDGVVNRQIVGDYVRNWQQFEWLTGAIEAVSVLRGWAPHLVVVTNQQGIGKGLMDAADVAAIHRNMQTDIGIGGEAIEAFQVCPHLESSGCRCRKPKPGLVLDWLDRHPRIDGSLSIVVGDSATDIELARRVATTTGGCASVHIGDSGFRLDADASFESLWDFAVAVEKGRRGNAP